MMKMKSTDTNFESFILPLKEHTIIVDGIEFKSESNGSNFMSYYSLLKRAETLTYFTIETQEWSDFKDQLIQFLLSDGLDSGNAIIVHISIFEDLIKNEHAVKQESTDDVFCIEKELMAHFGANFLFDTHLYRRGYCDIAFKADIVISDNAPSINDVASDYIPMFVNHIDLGQICHLLKITHRALHFHLELGTDEVYVHKVIEFIVDSIKKCPIRSTSRILIQISLNEESEQLESCLKLTKILHNMFDEKCEYFDIGYAALLTENSQVDIFISG